MNTDTDPDLREWSADWQAGDTTVGASQAIRDYVEKRSRLIRRWMWGEAAVAVVALPVLGFIAWGTQNTVERTVMFLLSVMTVGAVALSRWNWRGMRDASARTTAEFVQLSYERIQRIRRAVWIGWGILITEVVLFAIWIPARVAGGTGSARFAWSWLLLMTVTATAYLLSLSRWVVRDITRFEALRRGLTMDGVATSPGASPDESTASATSLRR